MHLFSAYEPPQSRNPPYDLMQDGTGAETEADLAATCAPAADDSNGSDSEGA